MEQERRRPQCVPVIKMRSPGLDSLWLVSMKTCSRALCVRAAHVVVGRRPALALALAVARRAHLQDGLGGLLGKVQLGKPLEHGRFGTDGLRVVLCGSQNNG